MDNKNFFNKKPFTLVTIIAVSFVLGLFISINQTPNERPKYTGIIWPNPPKASEFTMFDFDKREVTEKFLIGTWNLVFFGFTHCPDICPATLSTLKIAEKTLLKQNIFTESNIIFVSVDTNRDNPQLVKRYLGNFSKSFIGLTGKESELKNFGDSLGAVFYKDETNDKQIFIDHSSSLFFLSPENELLGVLTQPFSSEDVVEKYKKITDFYYNNLN